MLSMYPVNGLRDIIEVSRRDGQPAPRMKPGLLIMMFWIQNMVCRDQRQLLPELIPYMTLDFALGGKSMPYQGFAHEAKSRFHEQFKERPDND